MVIKKCKRVFQTGWSLCLWHHSLLLLCIYLVTSEFADRAACILQICQDYRTEDFKLLTPRTGNQHYLYLLVQISFMLALVLVWGRHMVGLLGCWHAFADAVVMYIELPGAMLVVQCRNLSNLWFMLVK